MYEAKLPRNYNQSQFREPEQYLIQLMHTVIKHILLLVIILSFAYCEYKAAPYAHWAHDHMVWRNGRDQSQSKMYELLKEYQDHDIPVGAINIDSLWSQCLNNFVVKRDLFPNIEQFIKNMHDQNIRVIMWTNSLINTECPQYKEALSKNYFLNNGKTVRWWRGNGSFVDFFNPNAAKWFEGLMDRVLDMGLDGFKVDGADPIILQIRPWPYSPGLKRFIRYRQYANICYGTFYNYTLTKNPEGLIMARAVDLVHDRAFLRYAPKYTMFMGWMGDQGNNPVGFRQAMTNIIHSASYNYLNFGFDIGGYLNKNPSMKWLFLRWAQVGAFLPFMENGGGGVHTPWSFDQQTVDIYRQLVLTHYDLKELFLTAGTEAYKLKKSVLEPLIIQKNLFEWRTIKNLGYVLWYTFLVEPIFDESGFVQVIFPAGYNWIFFHDHNRITKGGVTLNMGLKISDSATWIRSNSVFPFKQQIWMVYLEKTQIERSIIGPDYSYDLSVNYDGSQLQMKAQMFYKNEQVKNKMAEIKSKVIRLIGVSFSDQNERLETIQRIGLKQTEYSNEFEFELPLNKEVKIQGIKFNYEPSSFVTE